MARSTPAPYASGFSGCLRRRDTRNVKRWRKARGTGDPVAIREAEAAARNAALPRLRLYDLRHMCATAAMERGVHIKDVQELLGHSTPALTIATYSHASVGQREQAVRAITDRLFNRTANAPQ